MNYKWPLYASLLANVVLLTIVSLGRDRSENVKVFLESPTVRSGIARPALATEPLNVYFGEAVRLHAKIMSCGVPAKDANPLLAAAMKGGGQGSYVREYWKPAILREYERKAVAIETQEQGRQLLLERFGQSVATDPAFGEFFQPLDAELPFLSPEKQVQVARLKAETFRKRLIIVRAGNPSAQAEIQRSYDASLKSLLTPEELFEYELRESPNAQLLLASGFDFTEQEYRDVYRILARQGNGTTSFPVLGSSASATKLTEIRKVLGDQRFVRYQQVQDPSYRMLRAVAGASGVSDPSIDAAYALLVGVTSIELLDASEKTELKRLLGEQVFAEVASRLGRQPTMVSRPAAFVTNTPSVSR